MWVSLDYKSEMWYAKYQYIYIMITLGSLLLFIVKNYLRNCKKLQSTSCKYYEIIGKK